VRLAIFLWQRFPILPSLSSLVFVCFSFFSLSLFGSEKMADDKIFFKSSQVIISVGLNGAENYLLWSRQILMHLKGQRLTGHVTGITQKPEVGSEKKEEEKVALQKWEADDGQVMSLFVNSLEIILQSQFMMLDIARQVWDRATEMYSQHGNHGEMYHLQTKLDIFNMVTMGKCTILKWISLIL
jgi:gag-polypeptide of LTR copia-type